MQIIALLDADGTPHLAYNTCQVCAGSPYAYFAYQQGALVCQNCGNAFDLSSVGQAAGGRAGGDASRLGDDDAARPVFRGAGRDLGKDVGQKWRDERRLTGAGRGGEDQAAADAVGTGGGRGEALAQLGQHLDHRQVRG